MKKTTNIPIVDESLLAKEDFWWLVGFLQGDGSVDSRNGIWFHSTDPELIRTVKSMVASLFRLNSSIYLETTEPPWKPRMRLAVYSRTLVRWLSKQHLRFGTRRWNVPMLSKSLFCPYLAGLFDAEGQVILTKGGRLSRFVIHSANGPSLMAFARRMSQFGVECFLRARRREGKPSTHYQLEVRRRQNLKWFVRNIERHSHLHRKKCYLTEELLPRHLNEGTPNKSTARKRPTRRSDET